MIGVHFVPLTKGDFKGVLLGPESGKAYFAYDDSPFWFPADNQGVKALYDFRVVLLNAMKSHLPAYWQVGKSIFCFSPDEIHMWICATDLIVKKFAEVGLPSEPLKGNES